jgi:hypothetical protein
MRESYVVGCHLAPVGEATAVAVVQLRERVTHFSEYDEQLAVEWALLTGARWHPSVRGTVKRRERLFDVTHLERLPLDSSYKKVAATLAGLRAPSSPPRSATVAVDVTDVGAAAVEELRAAALCPVTWTITPIDSDAPATVAAPDLVALLAVLLQEHRLRIAAELALTPVLAEELKAFTVRPGPLAAALALACWQGERTHDPSVWGVIHAN